MTPTRRPAASLTKYRPFDFPNFGTLVRILDAVALPRRLPKVRRVPQQIADFGDRTPTRNTWILLVPASSRLLFLGARTQDLGFCTQPWKSTGTSTTKARRRASRPSRNAGRDRTTRRPSRPSRALHWPGRGRSIAGRSAAWCETPPRRECSFDARDHSPSLSASTLAIQQALETRSRIAEMHPTVQLSTLPRFPFHWRPTPTVWLPLLATPDSPPRRSRPESHVRATNCGSGPAISLHPT